MAEQINRAQEKAQVRQILRSAQVNPRAMVALLFVLTLLADTLSSISGEGLWSLFISVLCNLFVAVLETGFLLYCINILRGERTEYLVLFDGFSFAGKIIALQLIVYALIALWSLLFIFPGIIAGFRYRFALLNLCENPSLSPLEALSMSEKQTRGYKMQLLLLDLSYLGWVLLAMLPALFYGVLSRFPGSFPGISLEVSTASYLIVSTLCSLWSLLIGVFYYPEYQSMEVRYFEIAKRTSGVTACAGSNASRRDGPDDLGGY